MKHDQTEKHAQSQRINEKQSARTHPCSSLSGRSSGTISGESSKNAAADPSGNPSSDAAAGPSGNPSYEAAADLSGNPLYPSMREYTGSDLLLETPAGYSAESWKRQGRYTLEDYYALPDDQRVELIDGVFYDMTAPAFVHQRIIAILLAIFQSFMSGKGGDCQVVGAPCDVQLDKDDRTMVQPDILVVCDRSKIRMRGVVGAPDLVIEVLSPSTRNKDTTLKTAKYCAAGVREYWIIDPDRQTVLVYRFEESRFPVSYTFLDKVPVGIWEGSLEVDFARIREETAFLYASADDESASCHAYPHS